MNTAFVIALFAVIGVAVVFFLRKASLNQRMKSVEQTIQENLEESLKQAKAVLSKANAEAQDIVSRSRIALEEEIKSRRQSITDTENRVMQK